MQLKEQHKKFVLIAIIVVAVISLTLIVPPTIEKIQCEEKGGKWINLLGGGCSMEPEACKEAGGIPLGTLPCRNPFGCPLLGAPGCGFG